MELTTKGPRLTDEEFFCNCLNLEYSGMDQVKREVESGNFTGAKQAFASYVKQNLKPERLFSIPYEKPENLYKLPDESDEAACERIKNHVLVSVGYPCDFGKENRIDWYANPTYNHYREWTWQLNRHHEMKLLAHEYRKTGNTEYARLAAWLFKSWVEQALCPGDVHGTETDCWRTIECGIRMGANWPYILHSFYRTDAFDGEILTDWYKSVWEHARRLYDHRTHGNWLIMEMNGLAQIGILYPEFKEAKEWLKSAFQSLLEELDKQIYPDGFQYELSTGYHDVVINNYQRLIEVADAYEVLVPAEMREKLLNACEIDIRLMMPDGTLPNINDGSRRSSKELLTPKMRILPGSEALRWVVSDRTEGKAPDYLSVALPYSGFFVMRNGWSADSVWALLDAAPFGRGHQHEDKLSLLIYAGGKLLLTEGGNYAYDDSEMRKYVLSTRSHNTVRVDGKDQNRRKRYEWKDEDIRKEADMKWKIGRETDYAEGNYREGYGDDEDFSVSHNRCVYFVKNPSGGLTPFFIVVDRLSSERSHSYEVLWHLDSENAVLTEAGVDTSDAAVLVSGHDCALEVIRGQETPEWQGFVATGTAQGAYRPVNCITATAQAEDCRIVTVIYPHAGKENPLKRVAAGGNIGDTGVELTLSDGRVLRFDEREMKERE